MPSDGLRRGGEAGKGGQRVEDQARAHFRQAVVQVCGGFLCTDGGGFPQQDRAGVEACLHLHDADAGFGVARHDGAVDRGRAAPAGQERGVDVEAAEARGIEDGLRQDQAIGDDDGDIRAKGGEGGLFIGRFQADGMADGQAELGGAGVDRGRAQVLAASGGAGGLGVDGAMSWPAARASRMGTEKSGVPMKTIFIRVSAAFPPWPAASCA
jgi:hypothetical protein